TKRIEHCTQAFFLAALLTCFVEASHAQFLHVLTQHNDNAGTGANLVETQLNTPNVGSGRCGILFSLKVEGQIYVQPLYVSKLRFSNGSVHNVVYVTTMQNKVYAFDADKPSDPLWVQSVRMPVAYNFMPMFPAKGNFTAWVSHGCQPPPTRTN